MKFFLLLATTYRKNLEKFIHFATKYSINKVNFLNLYQDTRDKCKGVYRVMCVATNYASRSRDLVAIYIIDVIELIAAPCLMGQYSYIYTAADTMAC